MKRALRSAWLLTCAAAACTSGPEGATIEGLGPYLSSINDLPSKPPSSTQGKPSSPTPDGDYSCTTQDYAETKQYDKIVALSANSESLWPGAIIAGDSVYTGLFRQLVFDRAPLAVSISLENLAGAQSMTMATPSLSSFRDGMGRILAADVTGSTPANLYSDVEQVYSEQQLTLALGASVGYAGAMVSASFNWDNKQVMSRYVVNYTQAYYTVDVDQPGTAADLFGPSVSLDTIKAQVAADSPPVYVSSITYGRMVIFTFESQYSGEELGAALSFAYKGGIDVSGSVSVSYKDILSNSKITAFILGGDGGMAAQSIDSYDALIAFIKGGGNYTKDSPGAPIAYKLAYLKDNGPARLSYTTDYSVKSCVRVGQKVQVTLANIKVNSANGDDSVSLYGQVSATDRAKAGQDRAPVNLLDKDRDHAVQIANAQEWPLMGTISDEIIDVVPQPGSVITLKANLTNAEPWYESDHNVCNDSVSVLFEDGWNKDVPIHCTGDGNDIVVTLHLNPI
jgi:thiol-activated cytolysin